MARIFFFFLYSTLLGELLSKEFMSKLSKTPWEHLEVMKFEG